MNKVFINGISAISAQDEDIFDTGNFQEFSSSIVKAKDQDYKAVIKPMMLRRMSQAVKMGLYCSKKALTEAGIIQPGAIIIGTGQGCIQDTEKFMQSMIESEEGLLAPTSFIQSTHNTVGGQIALELNCNSYNMTYTQNSGSFESALLDSLMLINTGEETTVLVGGVDETSPAFTGFQVLDGQICKEQISGPDLLKKDTPGTMISESASFFVLDAKKQEKSYACVRDVCLKNRIQKQEPEQLILEFLKSNELDISEIDAVILGNNGDCRYDGYYSGIQEAIFSKTAQLAYKHLVGDNHSISAYAMWLGARIIAENRIPEAFQINHVTCDKIDKVLIYNQYLGKNHGLILLEKP
ncbi:beta-ketoacyl synthase chain length factor [Gramella sp. GC03-9]|uniref:Beta-ketoacyl synthase chain length factor n=1 Tax=Christiangramia oceanisediminis TaxID=2920386 RepID=A0A9X2R8P8_9FLAO|nr:beta-ketoacyl synthase chain length factor [Gramella oceanisediminis]MCP9200467.1 beta-ketoacyl synthase chain length factor [Gramella oceanisediminis]